MTILSSKHQMTFSSLGLIRPPMRIWVYQISMTQLMKIYRTGMTSPMSLHVTLTLTLTLTIAQEIKVNIWKFKPIQPHFSPKF